MQTNPYQAPTVISEPEAMSDITVADFDPDGVGIPYHGFLQYRRAALCSVLTMFFSFACITVDMFRNMSMVEGAISSLVPTTMLIASAKVMRWRTVSDAELTLKKYRDVSTNIRRHFLCWGQLFSLSALRN